MKFKRALILCVMGLAISVMAGPFNFPTSGSSGSDISASSVNDLNDVDASTATAGNVMTLRGDGQWVGSTVAGTGDVVAASDNAFSGNNTMSGPLTLTGTSSMTIRGDGFSVGGSTLAVSLGKVGIGTTAPSGPLDVLSNSRNLVVSTNGYVGIGTTNPLELFHVREPSGAGEGNFIFEVSDYMGSYSSNIKFYQNGTDTGVGIKSWNTSALIGGGPTSIAKGLRLDGAGDTFLSITDHGVGVNTETSFSALSVSGGAVIGSGFNNGNYSVLPASAPENGLLVEGNTGIGTSTPTYQLHVFEPSGTAGTIFAVSSGTVDLFRVLGTSVNLKVPLVFPDGTVQVTAPSVSGAADNLGNHVATTTLNMATNAILGITSGTFSGDVTVYGSIKGGSGFAVLSATPLHVDSGTSRYIVAPSSIALNGWLLPGVTNTVTVNISTDATNGFASRTEPILQVPTGKTWTITKVIGTSLPSGATVQFNLDERTPAGIGSAGTAVFTVTHASATVGGGASNAGVTSFSNASIASDNYIVATTPATGHAGGPNRLIFTIWYLEQ